MNPDEIDKAIAALKAQGAPDDAIHAYLRDTLGMTPVQDGHHDYHAEFRSGKLQQRMESANQRDVASAEELDAAERDQPTVAAGLANLAHAIPGAEALQAGARSLARGQTYREAYDDIEHARSTLPLAGRLTTEIAGGAPLVGLLPGSPALSGAIVGAADQALTADPDAGLGERAVRGTLGAAGGAILGKGTDMLFTAGRALMPSLRGPAANILERQAERASSAAQLYGAAVREGRGKTVTQALQKYVEEPDIAEIVGELQQTRPFHGVEATDPRMLDAIYKTLSDRAAQLRRAGESVTPNRPNIGRYRAQDVQAAQGRLLNAMEAPGTRTAVVRPAVPAVPERVVASPRTAQSPPPTLREALSNFDLRKGLAATRQEGTVEQQTARRALERHGAESAVSPPLRGAPGPRVIPGTPAQPAVTQEVPTPPVMSSYRDAVEDFARRSSEIEALKRGYDAVRQNATGTMPRAANLTRTTPEAFAEFMGQRARTAGERVAAREGALGAAKDALKLNPLTKGRRAVSTASGVMRDAMDPEQIIVDRWIKAGILPLVTEP